MNIWLLLLCISIYGMSRFIKLGQQVQLLDNSPYRTPFLGVCEVIITWLLLRHCYAIFRCWQRDSDKSQYLQLWMGFGHQIWNVDKLLGRSPLDVSPQLLATPLLGSWPCDIDKSPYLQLQSSRLDSSYSFWWGVHTASFVRLSLACHETYKSGCHQLWLD